MGQLATMVRPSWGPKLLVVSKYGTPPSIEAWYCRPFAPESAGPQPGIVIRFPTTVTFGLNFFGFPLGGGDSAYDPSLFSTKITTARGLRLQRPPFAQHHALLAHRSEYTATQALGTLMRDAGVEAFEFVSALDPDQGINLELFTPNALATREP